MKRAINVRLEENILVTLERLSTELHTTKTEVIEKAIQLFSNQNQRKNNELLQFAGSLSKGDADLMIKNIKKDKASKEFLVDL